MVLMNNLEKRLRLLEQAISRLAALNSQQPAAFEVAVPRTENDLKALQALGFFVSKVETVRDDYWESERIVMKRPLFFVGRKRRRVLE